MAVHKWEIRYPQPGQPLTVFALLLFADVALSSPRCGPGLSTKGCTGKDACDEALKPGYCAVTSTNRTCLQEACLDENIYVAHPDDVPSAVLEPKLSFSQPHPLTAGSKINASCQAYALADANLLGVNLSISGPPMKEVYRMSVDSYNQATSMWVANGELVVSEFTLTDERHGQEIKCGMEFGPRTRATAEQQALQVTKQLYAFQQSQPTISGPKTMEPLQKATWVCTTEEVTYENPEQFRHIFTVNPSNVEAESKRFDKVVKKSTPKTYKVTQTLTFVVTMDLSPAFFLACMNKNDVLGSGDDDVVTMFASTLRVNVVVKPHSLEKLFNLVGVGFGAAAFFVGCGLLYYYLQKRGVDKKELEKAKLEQQKAGGPVGPTVEPAPAEPVEESSVAPEESELETSKTV